MKVAVFTFNDFGENTYIVYDSVTSQCAIIDPGMVDNTDVAHIVRFIDSKGLQPVHLINTHQHVDHVMGNGFIRQLYDLSPEGSRKDEFLGQRVREQAAAFGMRHAPEIVEISTYLEDGDEVRVGNGRLQVLAVPGHSPGSIALYDQEGGYVITGDALFQGSIGRTDLPGGDFDTLVYAIRSKLLTLPDDTVVLPGHGPSSTIGSEKHHNPYFR